jgi:Flp pilus assembly protein TadG
MTRKQFETLAFAIVALAFLLCIVTFIMGAQSQAPASPYQPTADQAKDLKIAVLTAQNANMQLSQAQQNLQAAYQALVAQSKKIKEENVKALKWPETVEYDLNTGQFVDHPKSDDKGEKK